MKIGLRVKVKKDCQFNWNRTGTIIGYNPTHSFVWLVKFDQARFGQLYFNDDELEILE